MIPEINIYTYRKIDSSIDEGSHPISEGTLPDTEGTWICKRAHSENEARFEQLGQELFRLAIPHQPKTQIARGKGYSSNRPYYLLSEKIDNLRPLSSHYSKSLFTSEAETDLGRILMSAIILHELDLQDEHIGFNSSNRLVKIDGDFTLAALAHPKITRGLTTEITTTLINNLPFIQHYYVYNWLDIVQMKKNYNLSHIISPTISESPHFRQGINQAILCFLLLSPNYLKQFISLYMPEDMVKEIYPSFLKRQETLRAAAMSSDSFLEYLTSSDAEKNMHEHLLHIKNFAAHSQFPVIQPDQHAALEDSCTTQFNALKAEKMRTSPQSIAYEFEPTISNSIPSTKVRRPSFDRNNLFAQGLVSDNKQFSKELVTDPASGCWSPFS